MKHDETDSYAILAGNARGMRDDMAIGDDSPCLGYGTAATAERGRLIVWHGGSTCEGGKPMDTLAVLDANHPKWYHFTPLRERINGRLRILNVHRVGACTKERRGT